MPSVWRLTTRKVAANMFTVRFLNAQLIKDWNRFNSIRTVKEKIMVEPWNGSIGVKGELQHAWFRVWSVPYDLRSENTMAYGG
jgi:hypothetical protein